MKVVDLHEENITDFAVDYKCIENRHMFLHVDRITIFDEHLSNSLNYPFDLCLFDKFSFFDEKLLLVRNLDFFNPLNESENDSCVLEIVLIDFLKKTKITKIILSAYGHDCSLMNDNVAISVSFDSLKRFELIFFDFQLEQSDSKRILCASSVDDEVLLVAFLDLGMDMIFMTQIGDLYFYILNNLIKVSIGQIDRYNLIKGFGQLCSIHFSIQENIVSVSYKDGRILVFDVLNQYGELVLINEITTHKSSHFQRVLRLEEPLRVLCLEDKGVHIFRSSNSSSFMNSL